jgi:hypothetical protein
MNNLYTMLVTNISSYYFSVNCLKALGLAIQNFSVSLSQSTIVKICMANSYFNCRDTAKEHLHVQKYHINITGELNFCSYKTHAHVCYSNIQFQHNICETYVTNNITYNNKERFHYYKKNTRVSLHP